jgi:fucose 4-O-acetylase-like acetyltransferase
MKIWSDAVELARHTPPGRNRYVDFLRALAILVVVFGHWLVSAPQLTGSGLAVTSMLGVAAWTHPLTWALQVMPLFFIVGGYANGASWEAARRHGTGYQGWLHGRLRRLAAPLLPLVLAWAVFVLAGATAGVDPALVSNASRLALIPTWFLAVYIGVVLLVPFAARAWERYGLASFWLPISAAVLVDALAFGRGLTVLRWSNYIFVWFAVHQLGFLWRSGRVSQPPVAAAWLAAGLAVLVFLVEVAGYPVAMLTVPGADFSNTRPPTVALAALAALHFGLVSLLEPVLSRWLQRPRPWAATVLVNAFIMTVFLWHSTVNALVIGAAAALGGVGLHFEPGSAAWWLARPAWLAVLCVALLPCVAVFGRFEKGGRRAATAGGAAPALQVAGALCLCLGVAVLAGLGMGTGSFPWLRLWPLGLALAGAAAVLWPGPASRAGPA